MILFLGKHLQRHCLIPQLAPRARIRRRKLSSEFYCSKIEHCCIKLIIASLPQQVSNICFTTCRKLSLLSFGEEAEKEENELAAVKEKIKSSHDVLNDPRLLKDNLQKKELVIISLTVK